MKSWKKKEEKAGISAYSFAVSFIISDSLWLRVKNRIKSREVGLSYKKRDKF